MNHAAMSKAEQDFGRARTRAFWLEIWSKLRKQPVDLLSFEEVKAKLRLHDDRYLGLQEIPLDNIVGSVGRYKDFDRNFFPRKSVNKDRWKAVDAAMLGFEGFSPIEVYKIGDAYFVIDGNHRVSVSRANNLKFIEAYVTELKTDVPFGTDTTSDALTLKEGYADFLRKTNLKKIRPDAEIELTETGRYRRICHHIEVHRYYLGLEAGHEVAWEDAVASWYDNVYMPMVQAMQEHDVLADLPGRTESDLYVWLIDHQEAMVERYGGEPMSPNETVDDFMTKLNGD